MFEDVPQWLRPAAMLGTAIGIAATIIFASKKRADDPTDQAKLDELASRLKAEIQSQIREIDKDIREDMQIFGEAVRKSCLDQLSVHEAHMTAHERECNLRHINLIQQMSALGTDIAVIKALMQERDDHPQKPRRTTS